MITVVIIYFTKLLNRKREMANEIVLAFNSGNGELPSLANLGAYSRQVNGFAMLSAEREIECARALRDEGDLGAARELIMTHLRLVVKIAREHSGYGLPPEDLIQEGNVGLMRAVKKFDPERGVRLAAYAAIWIKSEIQEYILENWRLVKIGAAKGLKKLFFNLRKMQEKLHGQSRLQQKSEIAQLLGVDHTDVECAVQWFAAGEVSLADEDSDTEERGRGGLSLAAPESEEPDSKAQASELIEKLPLRIRAALSVLTARESEIVQARYLENGGTTLAQLSKRWSISLERVRQVESAALKKMKVACPDLHSFI